MDLQSRNVPIAQICASPRTAGIFTALAPTEKKDGIFTQVSAYVRILRKGRFVSEPKKFRSKSTCCGTSENMTDEFLRQKAEEFLRYRNLTESVCARCKNFSVSRKTCHILCLADREKTKTHLAPKFIPCDTFVPGQWDLTD